jgi:hypothetical protein
MGFEKATVSMGEVIHTVCYLIQLIFIVQASIISSKWHEIASARARKHY